MARVQMISAGYGLALSLASDLLHAGIILSKLCSGTGQMVQRSFRLSSSQPECVCVKVRLLLLLSRFSRVRLCATSETAAHQAPPSQGFSRQEHWSGLPFPSLMHEKYGTLHFSYEQCSYFLNTYVVIVNSFFFFLKHAFCFTLRI